MKTYKNHFRNEETFKRAITKIRRNEWADWLKIGKDWYTIEEYDSSGKNMRFASITAMKFMDIDTQDRYRMSDPWLSDAVVEFYPIEELEELRFETDYYKYN